MSVASSTWSCYQIIAIIIFIIALGTFSGISVVTNDHGMHPEIIENVSDFEVYPHNLSLPKKYTNIIHHLTMCIGVQKSGTTSLSKALRYLDKTLLPEKELHYFDWEISKYKHGLDTFDEAIHTFYEKGLSIRNFVSKLPIAEYLYNYDHDREKTENVTFFEKTPINILYPHVAYIIANDMIRYGVKIIILLRNPVKRFISGYFHEKARTDFYEPLNATFLWEKGIDGYINDIIYRNPKIIKFNKDITEMYGNYLQSQDNSNSQDLILQTFVQGYNHFIYDIIRSYDDSVKPFTHFWYFFYFIWIRSCYSPQIMTWIYYIQKMNFDIKYKHSIKIIQSERYYDHDTFHKTMAYLLCYMNYNIDNRDYNKWMDECIKANRWNFKQFKSNSKTKHFKPDQAQIIALNESYTMCNKWLHLLLDQKYHHMLLHGFEWDLW